MTDLFVIYGLDLLILLLGIGAAVMANLERTPVPFPRRHLLFPGLLAFAGTVILLAYPEIRDLANPQVWLIAAVAILIGAVRGWAMGLESDQAHGLVRVLHGRDAALAGWLMVLFAAIQGAIETGLREENPYETTAEFAMLLTSGYLLGRSIVAWLRARSQPHHDLVED
jgi:hypothetical protein